MILLITVAMRENFAKIFFYSLYKNGKCIFKIKCYNTWFIVIKVLYVHSEVFSEKVFVCKKVHIRIKIIFQKK